MGQAEFLHSLKYLQTRHRGCVATIGSFDGVHRGHQAVLEALKAKAEALNLPSLVMVFEPQPFEYFDRHKAPPRLMRLREKVCALFAEGVDRVLCLKFDEALRSLSAKSYIEDVLIKGLAVKHLVIGDDFRFGADRSGDFGMLQRVGKEQGFSVCDTATLKDDQERISSSRIRKLLGQNSLADAAHLLGRDYSISGRVIYGKQLGRSIGFPTVNIAMGRMRTALQGVYAVEVGLTKPQGAEGIWQGVANVGMRPTVESASQGAKLKPLLEVHLFDTDVDLYSKFLTVRFKQFIRPECRFESIDALKQQIQLDSESAKQFFK
ncbi:MAG: bifunctional riboflavin kinase/FAD synthetase [Agarilytica sp.]